MQLSPSVSRLLDRRCKEKENKALSRCQCSSGLTKTTKTSSSLGVKSPCGFVSVKEAATLFPLLAGTTCLHNGFQGLSSCSSLLHISQQEQEESPCSPFLPPAVPSTTAFLQPAREHHCSLGCHVPPNHTQLFPYLQTALRYHALMICPDIHPFH